MNFTLATDLGGIDLPGHLSSLGEFPSVALDAISMPLFGGEYRVASLDSLIRSKRAAGRNKDLNVLPELEALKEMHAQKEQVEAQLSRSAAGGRPCRVFDQKDCAPEDREKRCLGKKTTGKRIVWEKIVQTINKKRYCQTIRSKLLRQESRRPFKRGAVFSARER